MQKVISTENAPKAIGPYSQAVRVGQLVFISGQIPLKPKSGELVNGGIAEQTRQVIDNLSAILDASGSSLSKVVKTSVYLKDLGDFEAMNMVYAEYFTGTHPARVTVQVSRLPKDVGIEIDAIAYLDENAS